MVIAIDPWSGSKRISSDLPYDVEEAMVVLNQRCSSTSSPKAEYPSHLVARAWNWAATELGHQKAVRLSVEELVDSYLDS